MLLTPNPSSCLLFSFQPQGQQLDLVRVWIQCYHLSIPELLLSHLRALCPLRNRDSGHMHCTELMNRKMLLSTARAPSWVAVFLSISFSSGNFSRWACNPDPRLLLLLPALSVNKVTVHPEWVCYVALASGFPGSLQACGPHCTGIPMVHLQQPHSLGVKGPQLFCNCVPRPPSSYLTHCHIWGVLPPFWKDFLTCSETSNLSLKNVPTREKRN